MLRIHRTLIGFVFGTICLVFVSGCWFNQTEWEERRAFSEHVYKLFWAEKFEALDELADELRSTKARFPGGSWKLPWVYFGFMPKPKPWPEDYCYNWNGCLDRFDRWRAKYPNSTTARIGPAWLNVQLAYAFSQGYPVDKITEENRALYYERLGVAQRQLDEARAAGALCPEFFDTYLIIGYSLGWDQQHMDDLFAEAVAFEPEYYNIYLSRSQWYYMGAAHETSGTWEQFIDRYTATLPKDEGALIYAYTIWSLYNNYFVLGKDVSWPKFRYGLDVMEKRYPGSVRVHNAFCRFAFEVQDKATARQLFAVPDFKYDRDIWGNDRALFRQAMEWAMTGPVENVVEEYCPEPPMPVSEVTTAVTGQAESPVSVDTNVVAPGAGGGDASPEDWDKALQQLSTTGVMKQRGKYVALVNGRVVRPGDIVPVLLGDRVFKFSVREVASGGCTFDMAGVEKGGAL